ncbi:MAG: DUF1624 domain-containing protein [Beijerinckiaceae bacterium]|nr:DUF1624 domain-containing protein [Beijerinckiaceae bacterium]
MTDRSGTLPRLALVDLARGVALLAMAVFHLAWDLSHLGFIATDVALHPGWRLFSQAIAASFLVLAGIGLALAHAHGVRAGPFWRRVLIVAGAAALVTAGTWLALPHAPVFFGILHCIAAGSVLALPFLGARWWLTGLAGVVVLMVPAILFLPGLHAWQVAMANLRLHGLWQHLGLTPEGPVAVDFVPLVPWFGVMLVGVAAGSWLVRHGPVEALAAIPLPRAGKALVWAGRRSLPIYLLHQPVLLGSLMLLAMVAPGLTISPVQRAEAGFLRDCIAQCEASGRTGTCRQACGCVLDELRQDPALLAQGLGLAPAAPGTDAAIGTRAAMCFARTSPR